MKKGKESDDDEDEYDDEDDDVNYASLNPKNPQSKAQTPASAPATQQQKAMKDEFLYEMRPS